MTNGGDAYDDMIPNAKRFGTYGCSRAGWQWFCSWTLLGWMAATYLAGWLLAKLGWEVGRWIGSWA